MIYAVSAVALVMGLCMLLVWDFGRHWLRHYERGVEASLIRAQENAIAWEVDRDSLSDRCDDIQTTLNLRVRELGDRVNGFQEQLNAASKELYGAADDIEASDARINARIDALEQRPTESPDVAELIKKIETQEAALRNFWTLVGQQFASKDELKTEVDKIKGAQAVLSATGNPPFRRRA